ncbi:uncharacterized [Tachysurus ichikawai]
MPWQQWTVLVCGSLWKQGRRVTQDGTGRMRWASSNYSKLPLALEGSGDFGSGDSLLSDDEDNVVLNDQEDMGDDEEYDDDDDDGYLS